MHADFVAIYPLTNSIVTYNHANENVPKNADVIMHYLFLKFEMFLKNHKNQICQLSVQRSKGKKIN